MESIQKKILILHTSVGLGHKSLAENIGWQLQAAGFFVRLEDIGKVQEGKFADAVIKIHQFINKHLPFVWAFLYRWGHNVILPFRLFIAGRNCQQTQKLLAEYRPDLIVTVQTTASAVVSYLKKKGIYRGRFGIGFSDFHLHPYWLYENADFYLANIEEQKQEMVTLGIAPDKIFVCGMTLKPKLNIDTAGVKNKFGVKPEEKIVLIASGSLGTGMDESLVNRFVEKENIKIIAVCGKNVAQFNNLAAQFRGNQKVTVLGFYLPMDELYAVADIFVTKPGGLSIAEALAWRLPILISHMLPGQEKYNYEYLLKKQLVMPKATNLIEEALNELRTREFKISLENNPALKEIFPTSDVAVKVVSLFLSSTF